MPPTVAQFWLLAMLLCSVTLALAVAANRIFVHLHHVGYWYRRTQVTTVRPLLLRFKARSISNPLLIKNLIKNLLRTVRASSIIGGSLLTGMFLLTAYLMAMNNANVNDALDALSWLVLTTAGW